MRSKSLLVMAAVALMLVTVGLLVGRHRNSNAEPASTTPVTLLYVPEHDADGNLSDVPSFWVTNHTEKVLVVSLLTIEARLGADWSPISQYAGPAGDIYFQTPRGRQRELNPYEAAYGNLDRQRVALPKGIPWRAKVSVGEKLLGIENSKSQIDASRRLLLLRLSSGNTNIPWHAFIKGQAAYRHRWTALSPEVLLESAPEQPIVKPSAAKPTASPPAARPEAIAKAREALRQKMSEVVGEQREHQPTGGAP